MITRRIFILWTAAFALFAGTTVCAASADKTQQWIEILQSQSSTFEKARACQQLGESGTAEAVPALAGLLNHDVLGVYARAGLERIPGPEASAALRDALGQTQEKCLIGVINSLSALRDEKAVPALVVLTRNSDPEIVKAALLALGRISNDEALPVVRQALVSGPQVFRADAAAACLLAAENQLNQGNTDVAQALYDAIRGAQVPVSYRIGATRGAIVSRKADRVAFLIGQLRSKEPAIRDVALLTIREIPSDALAAALNAELENAERDLQTKLMVALKDCHNAQSLQVIKTKVKSDDPGVRLTALRVLAAIGGPDDASAFLDVIKDGHRAEELSIAIESLEQMEGAGVDEMILKALRSSDESQVRVQLIRLLGKRNVTGATDELLRQAAGPDRDVGIAAFQALRTLAGFDELPRLIALTKECRDDSVRDAAVSAVYGACKNDQSVGQSGALVLKELKTSTVTVEKESWIRVLALLGYAEALPDITAALEDADQKLVQSTISHLGRWPEPAPIDALFGVVEGDCNSSLRRQALAATLQLATAAADREMASDEELIVWFRRAKRAVRSVQEKRLLISGVGRVKHIESVRLSASYLGDADVKTEAAYAIVNAAEPLAKGPDYKAVQAVLKRITGVRDQRLLDRIASLQREIEATAARGNH